MPARENEFTRVFSCSWGQLEAGGSNIGDEAIFLSQVSDLAALDVELGVMSATLEATAGKYGAKPFDVRKGRLRAMLRGILWSDVVIVGGGELAQDVSSLLYTPFNLLPLRLAALLGKKTYAWSVGIGQGNELAGWTPGTLKRWLGRCRGVTVRDKPSLDTLIGLGLSASRVKLSSDSTFTLAGDFGPGPVKSDLLGFAPRNVSNRQRKLLPLETRRKLGMYKEPDVSDSRLRWAELLDRHLRRFDGRLRMFPFHSGSLSNSDDSECREIASLMKHGDRVELVSTGDVHDFMKRISECRVFLTVPLHGSILSVVTGAVPVALPYASKGFRFMKEAGLGELAADPMSQNWSELLSGQLDHAWINADAIWEELSVRRSELIDESRMNSEHFRATCLGS